MSKLRFISGGNTKKQLDRKRLWHRYKGIIIGSLIAIVVLFGIVKIGIWLFSDLDSGPDSTTYYHDENGNGQFDKGEYNWTEDEDGNIIDIDEDGSNF